MVTTGMERNGNRYKLGRGRKDFQREDRDTAKSYNFLLFSTRIKYLLDTFQIFLSEVDY